MLDLKEITHELISMNWHCGGRETLEDNLAINAMNQRDLDVTNREKQVVHWLQYYKVLMFFPPDRSAAIAEQIIKYADGPREKSLHHDKNSIVAEFRKLEERVLAVAPRRKTGVERGVTSLTSKALWCCYPDDVPIFDRNAVTALRVISRLCHLTPTSGDSEYARFVDLWLQVYMEVEPVIGEADLSDCPHKTRVLDRVLWYLGQDSFYEAPARNAAC